jgi:hypothetical protein
LTWHFAACAATYFVSASLGSDVNAGKSPDGAWRTISKVNHSLLSTGDRVYFLVGDVWDNEFLTMNWNGTAANHAVIGAYHIDPSGAVVFGTGAGNQRPVIDDHYQWHAQAFTTASGSTAGINVSGSYVDVENIEVRQSGWGVLVRGTAQTDVTVSNVFVNGAFQCGIQADGITHLTI